MKNLYNLFRPFKMSTTFFYLDMIYEFLFIFSF